MCGNRHWYLKSYFDFPREQRIAHLIWDPLEAGLLHLLAANGAYRRLEWAWTTSRSFADGHQSVVASIDGGEARLGLVFFLKKSLSEF